jgi:hypothetical protein
MSDVIERLNAALEGRYRIEREIGKGGMATVSPTVTVVLNFDEVLRGLGTGGVR